MKSHMQILTHEEALKALQMQNQHASRQNYLAMFSTWLGGITKDPTLMMIPIDDHIVHRGDGIFEAFKCIGGKVYTLQRHLKRLEKSAELVHLELPFSRSEITEIICETIRAAQVKDCLIRLYVSRGPGGFTTNPYECLRSQLYVVITALKPYSEEKYQKGVTLKTSSIPVKEGFFANVKSCNYLANVLMKKEAIDAGVDFTVSLDEKGFLAEGSTENFAIISSRNEFLIPSFDRTLRGITVTRMMELAEQLVKDGELVAIREENLRPEDAYRAREAMMLGTTLDVIAVTKYDGHTIGDGVPGNLVKKFREIMLKDQKTDADVLTEI